MSKIDDAMRELGISTPEAFEDMAVSFSTRWAFARWLFQTIIQHPFEVTRDKFHGHFVFQWNELPNDCALEVLLQPEVFKNLPHEHTADNVISADIDSYQLFTIAFSAVSDSLGEHLPNVNHDTGTTDGPTIFYTENVFLKAVIPGLSNRG